MFKKFFIFSFLILALLSCGTDYFYSSFYIRKDLQWPLSPSEQADLNYRQQVVGNYNFNQYTSPAIVATPDNHILVIYENRTTQNGDVIGIDGNKIININYAMSKNATSFSDVNQNIGGVAIGEGNSRGAPIAFVNRKSEIVVLAIAGTGFGGSSKTPSKISISISTNSGYLWSDWEDLPQETFSKLSNENYDRYYTNPGNGTVLRNGTLACIIDFKKASSANAEGFAIFYSTDDGKTWQVGSTVKYTTSHRFARIITERNDGKLLIAAVANTGNDYNNNGALAWYLADSLNGNINSFSASGLPNNSGGSVSGGIIRFDESGISKEGIILLHSIPNREYVGPNGAKEYVKNAAAISISEDNGANWKTVTNILGKYDSYVRSSTFRQSLIVLKDGTMAAAFEEGKAASINNNGYENFVLAYRRFSLEDISGGKYKYNGI
ncbi:sialidase family protein [Brachyspira pilosicoli]|uniref:sialidase family protein n=1 Tax=Brachyspira pilosicoli TaxID=52584 RepID=UPI0030060119